MPRSGQHPEGLRAHRIRCSRRGAPFEYLDTLHVSKPIHLHLGIRVKEGQPTALVDFLREAVPYYEAPGGIRVRLLQSRDDRNRFIEVVECDSSEHFAADERRVAAHAEMQGYLRQWRSLLEDGVAAEAYDDLTEQIHGS